MRRNSKNKLRGFTAFSLLRSGLHRRSLHERGFTLIEILIVIAIIGVLSAAAITLLNPLEQFAKARDSERKKTLRELGNALERFLIKKGHYPITILSPLDWYSSELGDHPCCPNGLSNNGDWIPGLLASKEITRLPKDPKGGLSTITGAVCIPNSYKRAYHYKSDAAGTCYKLLSHCGPETDLPLSPDNSFFNVNTANYAYGICSPPNSFCCINF